MLISKSIRGHVSKDHIHIFISMPPQISEQNSNTLKGKTSRKLLEENALLGRRSLGSSSRGFFAVSSGSIIDEMIMEYIENQDEEADKRG